MSFSYKQVTMILIILAAAVFLSGCSEHEVHMCPSGEPGGAQEITGDDVFVCPDGSKSRSMDGCSYPLKRSIDRSTAEDNALNYVTGYVSSQGWGTNLVNVDFVNGTYEAQIILSKQDKRPFETIVSIDGEKGSVKCKSGCSYIS